MMPATFVVCAWFQGIALGEIYSGAALFYVPVSYLMGAMLGIPMVLIFRHFRLTNVFAYVFGGAIIGLVVAYLIQELLSRRRQEAPLFVIWMVGCAMSAFVFRLLMFGWKSQERT